MNIYGHTEKRSEKALQSSRTPVTLAVKDGLYICPVCKEKTQQAFDPATNATNLRLWCKKCKSVHYVNIVFGQCSVVSRYR